MSFYLMGLQVFCDIGPDEINSALFILYQTQHLFQVLEPGLFAVFNIHYYDRVVEKVVFFLVLISLTCVVLFRMPGLMPLL